LGKRPTNLCPYRGLFAFREEDAPFFFGRFDFTEKLVEAVANQSLVAVVGPSGIGKSSVVFAGLIPQLRREGNWQVVHLRPSDRPFSALATAILPLRESDLNLTERRQKIQELATYLRDKNGALRDEVEGILWDNSGSYLLLVVDQWEELYTVCQDDGERRCFLDRLLEATSLPNFKLVLTLRADFLGVALSDRIFADALQHQDLKLGPMNRQELENAIALPAEKLGVTIEDGLTKRILDGVEKQPGNLPLLEFALTELWSNMNNATLTHAAYDRIGGVEKALANHAEAVFVKYPEEQERMRRIFIQLVHPGEGTEDTRRVASRAEVGEDNWDLAVRLASERLVVSSGKEATDSETVEIVHEALIWGWERLQEWIHANRRFRTWQERLRVSLRQWQENQRHDGALLQRVPLAEAEGWLQDRGGELSLGEREFIRLSGELRDREQAEKEATEQAQQILDKAYQKARRRIGIGSAILAVSLVGAVIAGVMAGNALHRQREAQIVTKLERQGVNALRQFESEQIESLVSAMGIGQELKTLVKDGRPLAEYPTVSPMLALQKILDNIREKNQIPINQFYSTDISFSSDGRLLIFTQDEKGMGKLSNLEGEELATFKGDGQGFSSVSFSPDGKLLATVGEDISGPDGKWLGSSKSVSLWNLKGKKLREFKVSNSFISIVKFSPDSKLIATANNADSGFVAIWDLNGKRLTRFEANEINENTVNFSPDSKLLVVAEPMGDIKIWDIERQKLLKFDSDQWASLSISFSPDGKILASAGFDGTAKLWNLQGQKLAELKRDFWFIHTVSFSPNGNLLATDGSNGAINLWNIKGEHLDQFKTKNDGVRIIFSPDGKQLATLGSDNTISLWNIIGEKFLEFNIKDKLLAESKARSDDSRFDRFSSYQLVKFTPDGKHLAILNHYYASLWDLRGQQLAKFQEDEKSFSSVYIISFSPDGKLLATSDYNTITLWNLAGKQLTKFKAEKDPIYSIHSISFSPDSKLLATGGGDGTVKLSNLTGKELRSFKAHQQRVTSISFSPDGKQFATAGGDNTAKLWDLKGELVATFKDDQGSIDNVSFNPNGQILATSGKNGRVKMWDISGKQLVGFKISESEKFFEFSPDGKLLATVGGDGIAKLWTLSGQQVAEFKTNQGVATSISFSPDGKQVAISGSNGKVLLRPVRNLDQLLAQGCDWLKDYFVTHPEARKNLQVCQVGKESKPPR
jgi:WD40 repeat protein